MGARALRGGRVATPYVSQHGGSAGERVLPPGHPGAGIAPSRPEVAAGHARLVGLYTANSTELIACHDPAGRILWASERAPAILGRPPAEAVGRTLAELAAPEDRPLLDRGLRRVRRGRRPVTCSYRVLLRNGRRRKVESTLRPVHDEDGELCELQSSTRLVTPPHSRPPQSGVESDEPASARLRELAAHLESVREEERYAIAREIHDDLGHQLTVLGLDLAGLAHELGPASPEIAVRLRRMHQSNLEILTSTRRIVTTLRPAVLDGFGLAAAIEWQAGDFSRRTGIATRIEIEDADLGLDRLGSTAVFRIFQEALTNVARHAAASQVSAALRRAGSRLELEVRDDGRGFEPAPVSRTSFGLLGMRERALALGGDLDIDSLPGRGTCVRLRVPM